DSGHQGAAFDASFMNDQEAALNFAQASVGKVTAAAKAIIARYYGQPATRSYFVGCSTGGREGMVASQRYPSEFDGIVAGAPPMRAPWQRPLPGRGTRAAPRPIRPSRGTAVSVRSMFPFPAFSPLARAARSVLPFTRRSMSMGSTIG